MIVLHWDVPRTLWLGMVLLTPFDLSSIDSGHGDGSLIERILRLAKRLVVFICLGHSGEVMQRGGQGSKSTLWCRGNHCGSLKASMKL